MTIGRTGIGQVREHLSETYRLHHRLVRTRRTDAIHASFGVRGRRRGRPFMLEVDDESADKRSELLDEFRSHLAALVELGDLPPAQAADAFIDLVTRCGSMPHALLEPTEEPYGPLADWLAGQGQNGPVRSLPWPTRWRRASVRCWWIAPWRSRSARSSS